YRAWGAVKEVVHKASGGRVEVRNPIRFQGQYHDHETGLHYNRFRYYDPMVGQYVSQDPIGLLGGINAYAYVNGNPLAYIDPLGLVRQLDPNGAECQQLKRKIQNKKSDINKRICEVKTNPLDLPYYPPYRGALPRMSVQGHEDIIRDLKDGLADDEALYAEKCGGGGTGSAPVASTSTQAAVPPSESDAVKAVGAGVIAYWIISVGSRLFPPRNLIPVP
ncbi:RHS repeat-associated core domain-containing protein, partial [Burkholderia cepacia]|uniref:RHS repeat-associated core domain-containing protein n=1 Tax=Burkholderia cepacia TaxID=292 RepID=UPI00264AEF63